MSRVFAYCRVSTVDQTTENQIREIASGGFSITKARTIAETVSGSVAASARVGFGQLLNKLESGDVLVVTKLDRLGRNAMDVRATVEGLTSMGVRVHCLALGGVDLTSPAGKMTMSVVVAMAEFERDLLIERTRSGLSRAKAEGKTLGRPSALQSHDIKNVHKRLAAGQTVSAIAKEHDVSRQTVMRIRSTLIPL